MRINNSLVNKTGISKGQMWTTRNTQMEEAFLTLIYLIHILELSFGSCEQILTHTHTHTNAHYQDHCLGLPDSCPLETLLNILINHWREMVPVRVTKLLSPGRCNDGACPNLGGGVCVQLQSILVSQYPYMFSRITQCVLWHDVRVWHPWRLNHFWS